MKVYINSIRYNRSLVDGPGVRTVVFFQGCDIHCKDCHNQSSWDITKGRKMEVDDLVKELREKVINRKITFSGGEPLMQKEALIDIVKKLQDFDIAVYTGHKLGDVPKELLKSIKYIKVGEFIEEKKTSIISYVGSSNQQFIKLR